MNRIEKRIQAIRAYIYADEGAPSGEEYQTLLDELHKLELKLQKN